MNINKWIGTTFLNISNNWLFHTATRLFTKSVSCRSAKFTTGDFECMVCLKKITLQYIFLDIRIPKLEVNKTFDGLGIIKV